MKARKYGLEGINVEQRLEVVFDGVPGIYGDNEVKAEIGNEYTIK